MIVRMIKRMDRTVEQMDRKNGMDGWNDGTIERMTDRTIARKSNRQ